MRQMQLTEIKAADRNNTYVVAFEDEVGRVEFEMWVEGDEIPVVNYEDSFDEYVHYNTGSLGPIFEVVLRFHHARAVPFPPQPVPGSIRPGQAGGEEG